jgi:hypothetical protein
MARLFKCRRSAAPQSQTPPTQAWAAPLLPDHADTIPPRRPSWHHHQLRIGRDKTRRQLFAATSASTAAATASVAQPASKAEASATAATPTGAAAADAPKAAVPQLPPEQQQLQPLQQHLQQADEQR